MENMRKEQKENQKLNIKRNIMMDKSRKKQPKLKFVPSNKNLNYSMFSPLLSFLSMFIYYCFATFSRLFFFMRCANILYNISVYLFVEFPYT